MNFTLGEAIRMTDKKLDLIIPVYLNQKLVFDLLAMLKGGISTVTQISSSTENSSNVSGKASSKFGLSEALSTLFKVDLSAEVNANSNQGQKKSTHMKKSIPRLRYFSS